MFQPQPRRCFRKKRSAENYPGSRIPPNGLIARMKTKPDSIKKPNRDLLVGAWTSGDEYSSDVEFTILRGGKSYTVEVRDGYDGEMADVFEIAWDGKVLSFATHWNSTGRFARYRIRLLSANRIDVTYTYTETAMYHRKPTKKRS
jgi:hypothetical protein